jgi:hypothetical protein
MALQCGWSPPLAPVDDRPTMPPRKPPSRHALTWLGADPAFARAGEHAARLATLQEAVTRCLPDVPVAVVALERDTLVLGAAHAAVAARLRQQAPTVLAALAREGWAIGRLKVRPRWRPTPTRPTRAPRPGPGAAAALGLRSLAEGVADPRLAGALQRLSRR